MKKAYSLSFILVVLLSLFSCQAEEKKSKRKKIDPKDIKIDVNMGGVMTPDQVLINYKVVGKGEKVLVVPNAVYLSESLITLADTLKLIFYDLRNRGRSLAVRNANKLRGGIQNDVKDLEVIRKHFKLEKFNLLAHGYLGTMAALYAKDYPERIEKIVQISSFPPVFGKEEPTENTEPDSLVAKIETQLLALEANKSNLTPKQFCDEWWKAKRQLYVTDVRNSYKVANICLYPNERPENQVAYFNNFIKPTLESNHLSETDIQSLKNPFLIIHGEKDRITPYVNATRWQQLLPNSELITVKGGGHFPWIEEEHQIYEAITTFILAN